jgi:hypothetical protein
MSAEFNSASLPIYPLPYGVNPSSWAGVVPETDQGYDIRAPHISEARRTAAFARANGILSDGISKVLFFVFETSLNMGISGTTSQGRYTRDFYAHNISLPALEVKAQCLDQRDYRILVEFVHQAQKKAVGNAANNITQLEINGGGLNVHRPKETLGDGIMKGLHKRICVHGFIPRIERKHKQGEYAPVFSFSFSIARSFQGIYEGLESSVYENQQASWISILEGLTTPYQPTYRKQVTATHSKPKETPAPLPEVPPTLKEVPLVESLPGGGGF